MCDQNILHYLTLFMLIYANLSDIQKFFDKS